MNPLGWIIVAIAVAIVGTFAITIKAEAGANTNAQAALYASTAVDNARGDLLDSVRQQVRQNSPDGPFTAPASGNPVAACPTVTGASPAPCNFTVQTTTQILGSPAAAQSTGNDFAHDINRNPTVNENRVAASIVATVYDAAGKVAAVESQTVTMRTELKDQLAEITGTITNVSGSTALLQADTAGCGGAQRCDNNGSGEDDTHIYTYSRCADTGNPAVGLCGPATPRPTSQFQSVTWQNQGASTGAWSR